MPTKKVSAKKPDESSDSTQESQSPTLEQQVEELRKTVAEQSEAISALIVKASALEEIIARQQSIASAIEQAGNVIAASTAMAVQTQFELALPHGSAGLREWVANPNRNDPPFTHIVEGAANLVSGMRATCAEPPKPEENDESD